MSLAFIACVEPGKLESQAILLFQSIRHFGGLFQSAPIYSFNPRGQGSLAPSTLQMFDTLNVTHSDLLLNSQFNFYPVANKVFVCAYAEETIPDDILVFLDTDSVILNEPTAFALPTSYCAAITPVWSGSIGTTGSDDPAEYFWQAVYRYCGITSDVPFVETQHLERRRIRAYFNAGMIVVRRTYGLWKSWKEHFVHLMSAEHIPTFHPHCEDVWTNYFALPHMFTDQVALAVSLIPHINHIQLLDITYNSPFHNVRIYPHPYDALDLQDIIHFHYNGMLHCPNFLQTIIPPLNRRSAQYQWLEPRLPLLPIEKSPDLAFLQKFAQALQEWRLTLQSRHYL